MASSELDQLLQQALAHHQAGRREQAEAIYRQILARDPGFSDAIHYLGLVLYQRRQYAEAWELMRRAIAIDPSKPHFHCNAAAVLLAMGENDAAIEACRRALSLRPEYGEAFFCLGRALKNKGQPDDAAEFYKKAVEYKPDHVEAWNELGMYLNDERRPQEAVDCFRKAIAVNPNFPGPHNNLGHALRDLGRLDEAESAFRRALAIEPGSAMLRSHLAVVLKDMGEVDQAVQLCRQALAIGADARTGSNLLYMLLFHERTTSQELRGEHRRWNQAYAAPLAGPIRPHTNDRDPERRLRVGYVSPDFRTHPVGRFLLPLMAHHDHSRFEVYCYSDVQKGDGITESIQSRADVWRKTRGLSDERLADLVREDHIDVLVDLTMHMADNRMLVFARKPAPVQVTYLAYPGTTGLDTIDYRLTDGFLHPPDSSRHAPRAVSNGTRSVPATRNASLISDESYYSEKSVRLRSYWCYQPAKNTPDLVPPPALTSGRITFGCLNNFCKMSGGTFEAWCELLRRLPNSRLILHAGEGRHRDAMRQRLAAQGIDPQRLDFVPSMPIAQYFAQYNQIDIALDPFPYPGGTTTCDALWMGVPIVTLSGQTAISRGGLSILSQIGLPELIAHEPEQYIQIALRLASDFEGLQQLRSSLRERMRVSPLMDAVGFARDVEAAYRSMWQVWCGLSTA